MKRIGFVLAMLVAASSLALAENSDQQNKMVMCNKEAAGMKGEERKTFMSKCLRKEKTMTQQQERIRR